GLHDHSSAKRVHRAPSLLCARRLLSLRQFLVHWERNENKPAISKAYRMGSILGWQDWSWTIGRTRRGSACSGNLLHALATQYNPALSSQREARQRTAALDARQAALAGASMSLWGQTRSWGHVGSMSGLPESGQGRAIYGRYGDARLTAACSPGILGACGLSLTFSTLGRT